MTMISHLRHWRKPTTSINEQSNNPFLSMQRSLSKAMSDFYSMFEMPHFSEKFDDLIVKPSIDIVEDKNSYKIEVEMPGVDEKDIRISIDEGSLTIKAEKKISSQDKDKNKNYMIREIGYGSYERTIVLPDYLDSNKANATFKKGMLWIEIPKKEESTKKARELEIKKL